MLSIVTLLLVIAVVIYMIVRQFQEQQVLSRASLVLSIVIIWYTYTNVQNELVSHGIAAVAGCGVYLLSTALSAPIWLALLVALLAGGGTGLLLSSNVLYGCWLISLALAQLAQGMPVDSLHLRWRWPLAVLFRSLNDIGHRVRELAQQKKFEDEYREQILQQASESAALEERNRIARELHDSIKQQIFGISISAAAARAHAQGNTQGRNADVLEAIEDIQRSAREAQVEMQALLQQLRSMALENTSLSDALRTQAQA